MSEQIVELKLLGNYFDGKPLYEMVPAISLGPNRYRIAASPGLTLGLAAGDEIELCESEKLGYRLLKRSGNVCVQMFFRHCDFQCRDKCEHLVQSIGGWLDGGYDSSVGHELVFTIPVSAGFQNIYDIMQQICKEFSVDSWMYGNVYDIRDGKTPLNWWNAAL